MLRIGLAILLGFLAVSLPGCADEAPSEISAEVTTGPGDVTVDVDALRPQVTRFCGACHAMPDPATFPKSAWYDEVAQGYRFYESSNRRDLSPPPRDQVVAWYRQQAPDQLPRPPVVKSVPSSRISFQETTRILTDDNLAPYVSHLHWQSDGHNSGLFLCDMRSGRIRRYTFDGHTVDEKTAFPQLSNPTHLTPTDLDRDGRPDYVVADMMGFLPEDHNRGQVVWLHADKSGRWIKSVVMDKLARVADVQPGDFDGDGDVDLVVAEFGWRKTGRILLLKQTDFRNGEPIFEAVTLDDRHGTIHVPVADLNGDGRLDFVALISQEHETVVAFLNQGKGTFDKQVVTAFPDPSFGSSGIQLVDLDGDNDLDVLYTNGDSMDSHFLKPYHGVRWLENRGKYPFTARELTTLPGASRAIAADLDGDGDLDIAVSAYLSNRVANQIKGAKYDTLIWLEQTARGKFARHPIESSTHGHLSLEIGDFDLDGAPDIAVGHHQSGKSARSSWLTIHWNRPGRAE